MEKICGLIMFIFFASTSFAQIFHRNDSLIRREIENFSKKAGFNTNLNTLNYDLKYQRMELSLDPAINFIQGSVTSHFLAKETMAGIYFDFTNKLTVSKVSFHGDDLSFQQLLSRELKIDFPYSIPENNLDSLTIYYSGIPDNYSRPSFFVGTHNGEAVLSTLSEPFGARNWFPTKQSLNDKIERFDFKITTPDQYSVASNGKLMSETFLPPNRKLTFWRTQYPMESYLAALSIANFVKMNDFIGNSSFPFVNYIYTASAANPDVMGNIEWTKTAMSIFETYFGPYPFANEKYGHMEFSVNGGGMEHQTMSSMNSFGKTLIAHELAHQWFGDKITCGAWNDVWLNEGFATFAEYLVFEKNVMTHEQFMTHLKSHIDIITSIPNGSVYAYNVDELNIGTFFNGRLTYFKGGYSLRMIKWILSDDVFYQAIKDYLANPAFAYGFAKTEDFKNQLLVSTGKDFTGFFNDWIYGQGYPSYQIKWNQQQPNQQIDFLISQTQSDPSVSFFELPLPIKLNGTNGETAYLVLDNSSNNQFFSKTVNFTVANVEFNYDYQILEKYSTVMFDPSLSTESVGKDEVVLFPNPVKNEINFKGIPKISEYEIYNIDGRLITKGSYRPNNSVNVSKLEKGVYFIKVNGKNVKFLKQ